MQFRRVRFPASDPSKLAEWYRTVLGAEPASGGQVVRSERAGQSATEVQLGDTTLQLVESEPTPPAHLAVRLLVDGDEAVEWLSQQATILPVEGDRSRYFEFLDATAIYFEDPAGNVLEGLCYAGDPRPETDSIAEWVDGVTEVGLPAREPLALVEWLEERVGLPVWGTPGETFAWVGDRQARFVVVPAGREWYPTDRLGGIVPISVSLAFESVAPGRYSHPTLPYEITVE